VTEHDGAPAPAASAPAAPAESGRRPVATLAELESVIERGRQTFVEVGLALLEIRDRRLFREQGYATFTDYCRRRWRFTPVRAVQLIQAAEVARALTVVSAPIPENEAQARALAPLRDDPTAVADAWRGALAAAPAREDGTPRVTAALVREAAEAVRERRPARSHAETHAERLAAASAAAAGRGASPVVVALPYDRVVRGVDAGEYLRALPDGCADAAITSPPYWMKRRYLPGDPRELGQEPDPADFVDRLCAVLDEVGRVLTPAGTLWLNLGDTLASQPGGYRGDPARRRGLSARAVAANATAPAGRELDVPAKSFCLIPETVALRLVLDSGWRLLAKIAWTKPNHQPENVYDRLTQAWEPVYVLTRARHAYLDRGAWDERPTDVWAIPAGRRGAAAGHPAPFPEELVRRALRHACPPGGVVLDPFAGSGTTLTVALEEGRRFLGCDLAPAASEGEAPGAGGAGAGPAETARRGTPGVHDPEVG
jgi:DNA modification methylase